MVKKIKIFTNLNREILESDVNDFILNKTVGDMQHTFLFDPLAQSMVHSVFIRYDDRLSEKLPETSGLVQ